MLPGRVAANCCRRGAAVVEFAVVLPLLLLLVVGALEVGRATMVQHKLVQAARAGCRIYAVKNEVTEVEVQSIIKQVMDDAGLGPYTVELDPGPTNDIEHLEPVTVTVSVAFDQVSRLPREIPARCMLPDCIRAAITTWEFSKLP
ncbi:MAG: pilus assembly protein [Candidatus Nealsonbacteria bacterium]|nr:pilus assembly protein [Candidatus Nealsonbacteria bacterium]